MVRTQMTIYCIWLTSTSPLLSYFLNYAFAHLLPSDEVNHSISHFIALTLSHSLLINSLSILGEQALRDTGCLYTIVRPTGLNDKMQPGGR